ncbi:MAG: DUF3224 domain-containing protein [Vicinamibacterales bacterium]
MIRVSAWALAAALLSTVCGGVLVAGESMRAAGTFDVRIGQQPADGHADGSTLGRMTLDKTYHGDLEGTAVGQMLTGMSPTEKTSGAYVAVERVTGTLAGRTGSFLLYHVGVMDRGAQRLTVTVVPDSGTGELTGLAGTLTIDIRGKEHAYVLDYALPAP